MTFIEKSQCHLMPDWQRLRGKTVTKKSCWNIQLALHMYACTYVYINHQDHSEAYMNIWVVKSIVKPNTNPTPCTKGMEDSPLDSGQTLIRHWLDPSTTLTHRELINFSCLTCADSWDGHDTWTKLPNKQVNHFHEKLPEFLLWGKIL